MAKYRITSIPQYAPGGETNGLSDWMKKKKKNSNSVTDYRPTSEEDRVQGLDPQNIWSNINPTNVPTAEEFPTYDIGPQDYGRKRTGLEQYETLPIVGNQGYGYKRNRYTSELETVPAGKYEDEYGRTGNVEVNRYIDLDNQGRPLNCPSGSSPYNGVCLTDEEIKQLIDKEESNFNYRSDVSTKEKKEKEAKAKKLGEEYDKKYKDYIENNTKKGSKNNKLEPFLTFNQEEWDKRGLETWYNVPDAKNFMGADAYYLEKKDLGEGKSEYKIYPRVVIEKLMSRWGARPEREFKKSGLNAEQLQGEYTDYLAYLDASYNQRGQELIDKYTKQGMSAQEAKQKLIKQGYSDEIGFNSLFKDVAESYDYKNNGDKFFLGGTDHKLYKTDRNNKVYEYNNDAWTLVKPSKELAANFKNMSAKDRKIWSDQGTYMAGNQLMVNGNLANFYGATLNDKQQTKVITDYKQVLSDTNIEIEKIDKENKRQENSYVYSQFNDKLYNHVYGTDYSVGNLKKVEPLQGLFDNVELNRYNLIGEPRKENPFPHSSYIEDYNKAIDELNAVTKNKKSTDSFEDIRKKKAAILEKFINRAGASDKKRETNNQPSWGQLSDFNYDGMFGPSSYQTKDITAYKDPRKLESQIEFAKDNEATNFLAAAYENDVLPNAYNSHTTNYRGTNLKEKYPTFQDFVQSAEGKSFHDTYMQYPDVGRTLFNNSYSFKANNLAQDKYDKDLAVGRNNLAQGNNTSNFTWENATRGYGLGAIDLGLQGLSMFVDQGEALLSQPVSTLKHWFSGELQDRGIGIIGDSPTERDLTRMDQRLGPGASSAYLEKLDKISQSPLSQFTNLVNPIYYAAGAGRGMGRKILGDPDQSYADIGENLLFALMGTKGGSKFMGTKPLSYMSRYAPMALKTSKLANVLKTNKVASRIGTAATNYGTAGNLLNAYFLNHAFVPTTNPETGETVQGFGTEAFKNLYEGFTDKDGLTMDEISPNIVNAYMAYSIAKHGLHNANYLSGNVLGKPALVPRLPIQDRISDGFKNFGRQPKIVRDPRTGELKLQYENTPTIKVNNNRYGENYHQQGGIVLPKARYGKEKKTGNERINERRRKSEKEIEKEVAKSLENLDFTNYVNATAPETMTLISNLKNNNVPGANYVEPKVGEKPVLPAEFVPAGNLNVENNLGFSALVGDQVPAVPTVPKAPWELQDLPGPQLRSLMSNDKIFKITEPKTGLVNLEQALGIIGQESGAPEKLAFTRQGLADFLQQGLDQSLPKKIDLNQLRSIVQGKIPAMETQLVNHNSGYGKSDLGYSYMSLKNLEQDKLGYEQDIISLNELISKTKSETKEVNIGDLINEQYPPEPGTERTTTNEIAYSAIDKRGNVQYHKTLEEAKRRQEHTLNDLYHQVNDNNKWLSGTIKNIENAPLENQTLIISNKDQFGQSEIGSHGNPPETLGHIHFLRDKETPDTATITQIQADPFQSKYYWKYNINSQTKTIGNGIMSLKDQLNPEFYTSSLSEEEKITINNKIEELKKELEIVAKENTPNYEQKVLLEASHEQRFLQEFVNYAARRGDINKIRIPTLETAAKVQNYRKNSSRYIDAEARRMIDNSNTFEEAVAKHMEIFPEDTHLINDLESIRDAREMFDLYKKGEYEPKFSPKQMTVLKKYVEQAKNVRKLFGIDTRPVTDSKGNTFQEFDIPKSFKDLKGEIRAYKEGGPIQMDLTQDEINSYANGGWIVEDLDTYQQGDELPKARFGKQIKTGKYRISMYKKPPGKYKFPDSEGKVIPTQSVDKEKAYMDMWNKLLEKRATIAKNLTAEDPDPIVPKLDERTRDLLKHPEFDILTGESSPGLVTNSDLQKNLENIKFKVWSDNWNSLQDFKNSMDGPQWTPTKDDYFSKLDFSSKIMDQMEYDLARLNFDYDHPDNPSESIFRGLSGDTSRDELFSNLYPNVGLPNFRNKILSPEQESYLEKFVGETNPSVYQRGMLNPQALKTINTGFDTLPKTYQELLESQKKDDYLKTAPAKDIVSEYRSGLGLTISDLEKATPEQLEKFRKELVRRKHKQDMEKWESDISNPFTGGDAWGKISKQSGYKNKFGGVSMKLSKDEIDKYVNGGYIVTEE